MSIIFPLQQENDVNYVSLVQGQTVNSYIQNLMLEFRQKNSETSQLINVLVNIKKATDKQLVLISFFAVYVNKSTQLSNERKLHNENSYFGAFYNIVIHRIRRLGMAQIIIYKLFYKFPAATNYDNTSKFLFGNVSDVRNETD